eukprot:1999996-Rhodomonas_salina.1
MEECQEDFFECMASDSPCECLGRLQTCAYDAGCDQMTNSTIDHLCEASGCTDAQCQVGYPQPSQCNWDQHDECSDQLHQCLVVANEAQGTWEEQQDTYAERCACYRSTIELFQPEDPDSCGSLPRTVSFGRAENMTQLQILIPARTVITLPDGTNISLSEGVFGNGSMFLPSPLSRHGNNYSAMACMSECMNMQDQRQRQTAIEYDCAVCGDRALMPGRE